MRLGTCYLHKAQMISLSQNTEKNLAVHTQAIYTRLVEFY